MSDIDTLVAAVRNFADKGRVGWADDVRNFAASFNKAGVGGRSAAAAPDVYTSVSALKHTPVSYTHLTLPTICSV